MEKSESKSISCRDLDQLIAAHDGDVALLALYRLRTGDSSPEGAAAALFRTMAEIRAAEEKLARMKFQVSEESVPALHRSEEENGDVSASREEITSPNESSSPTIIFADEELPEYTTEDVTSTASADSSFKALMDQAAVTLGRPMNTPEMKTLLGIYRHLGLPAEVIYLLLNYCGEVSRGAEGQERKPTMSFIRKQAYIWTRIGLTDYDAAEAYVEKQLQMQSKIGEIQKVLSEIGSRKLVSAEQNHIQQWIEMGFGPEAVSKAYEITVYKTGKLTWPYLHSILQCWHNEGYHTVKELQDARKLPETRPNSPGPVPSGNHGNSSGISSSKGKARPTVPIGFDPSSLDQFLKNGKI